MSPKTKSSRALRAVVLGVALEEGTRLARKNGVSEELPVPGAMERQAVRDQASEAGVCRGDERDRRHHRIHLLLLRRPGHANHV